MIVPPRPHEPSTAPTVASGPGPGPGPGTVAIVTTDGLR